MLGGHPIESCKILPDGTVLGPDGTKIGFVEVEGADTQEGETDTAAPESAAPQAAVAQDAAQEPQTVGAAVSQPHKTPADVKEGKTPPQTAQVAAQEPPTVGADVSRPHKTPADVKEGKTPPQAAQAAAQKPRTAGAAIYRPHKTSADVKQKKTPPQAARIAAQVPQIKVGAAVSRPRKTSADVKQRKTPPEAAQIAAQVPQMKVGAAVSRPRKTSADVKEEQTWLNPIPPESSDLESGVSTPRFAKHQAAKAAEAAQGAELSAESAEPTCTDEELELEEEEEKQEEEEEEAELPETPGRREGAAEEDEDEKAPKKGAMNVLGVLGTSPSLGLPFVGLGGTRDGVLIVLGNTGVGKTRLLRALNENDKVYSQPGEMHFGAHERTLLPTLGKQRLSSPKGHCDMVTWDMPGDMASRPLVMFSLRGLSRKLRMMPHVLLMCDEAPGEPAYLSHPPPLLSDTIPHRT